MYSKLKRPGKAAEDCSTALDLLLTTHHTNPNSLFDAGGDFAAAAFGVGGGGVGGPAAAAVRDLRVKLLQRRAVAHRELGKLKEAVMVSESESESE